MSGSSRESSVTPETSPSAGLLSSGSNLGVGDDRNLPNSPDNNEQNQNMEIIKNLLEMFNMDETMRKYETKNVVDFVLDPNDFGYDCSLSTTRVRQRLCDLMGTDVIRLNDKRYFQRLSQRLQEEYDGNMDKQEDSRAHQEDERLRRLMLEGVIDAPNDYRAVVHGEMKPKAKKTKKRKIKRRIRIADHPSEYSSERAPAEGTTPRSEEDRSSTQTSKEDVRTQVEVVSSQQENRNDDDGGGGWQQGRQSPTKSIMKKPGKNNDKTAQQMHARPPHHDHIRSSSSCSVHRTSRRIKSAAPRLSRDRDGYQSDDSSEDTDDQRYDTVSLPDYNRKNSKYSKQEPEVIRKLRKEQTVAGLYTIAEELVSPLRVEDTDRKVHRTAQLTVT